jgi:hypothetical protein
MASYCSATPAASCSGTRGSPPLFDELQRRAAVVFVHPNPSPDPSAHALGLPDTLIAFTADTTRAIAQLHYSSTFARTPTSSTSSPAPEVPCPTWPGGSASSTNCASSPEPRAARLRPRHSAACTGIPRRPGATHAAHAARRRGNRTRRIRHRLPLPAPRSGRLLPRPHRGRPGLTDGERTAVLGATGATLIPDWPPCVPGPGPALYNATGTSLSPRPRSCC